MSRDVINLVDQHGITAGGASTTNPQESTLISIRNKQILQRVLNAESYGRTLFIPAGEYYLEAGIHFGGARWGNVNTTLEGASSGYSYTQWSTSGTRLKLTKPAGAPDFEFGFDLRASSNDGPTSLNPANIFPYADSDYSSIRNCHIDCQKASTYGIAIGGAKIISECTVTGAAYAGLLATRWLNSSILDRCNFIKNGVHGVMFQKDPGPNTKCDISNCSFRENGYSGAFMKNAKGARFASCTFEANGGFGLWILPKYNDDVNTILFDSCWFENNFSTARTMSQIMIDAEPGVSSNRAAYNLLFRSCTIAPWNDPSNGVHGNTGVRIIKGHDITFDSCLFNSLLGNEIQQIPAAPMDIRRIRVLNCLRDDGTVL